MANKILLVFIGFDLAFLACAALHLVIPLYTRQAVKNNMNVGDVATNLLLDHCPLTASEANSVIMFITFLLSIPAFFLRRNRVWLKIHVAGVIVAALMTLSIGLAIWFSTLEIHKNLTPVWMNQSANVQSMLQQKFKCCGYTNPALFIKDDVCTSAATAAKLGPCVSPFGVFANRFLDIVFTTFFGFVAVDMMLLLAALCLIKDRKEKKRYRLIDEKRGFGPI
ncbi:uncharacterized protein PV06_09624 [Exophiala oligosperma]|uniref:Tetraspanin n=2 Tax=Chaetothyriales TaxID=34395 RepID=A0A0D2D655_9EURO|nr:uncharacterized protein PV06_09624 [Exophiala oligosperma]KAJ9638484.1 hypothetical protein H2204_004254 [Knufia peltigerae]KIW38673.1 hypothetical protein PV06_09624 [Exophiala oligosperma]